MNLWSSLRSLFSVAANNSTSSRKGQKALELKPRHHLIEQCEDRVLLSVSPTGLDDVYGSEAIRQAIITASNLDRYDSVDMSNVTKWVVGVTNRTDISAMAGKYGATNLGETILNNSYVWEFSTNTAWETAANYLQNATGVDYFYPLVPLSIKTMAIDDPLYQYQWNLGDFSVGNAGIGVEGAWLYATGSGVSIAVVDTGTEYTHEDLYDNYSSAISYDFIDKDTNPSPEDEYENHGTSVAGIIAADDNGLGVVGVAYDSTFGSIRIVGGDTDANDYANALTYALDTVDIYNNSWGATLYEYGTTYYSHVAMDPLELAAIEMGVTQGRDGKGAIYVFAAGNEGEGNIDVNMMGYTNSRYVITVGAVNQDGTKCEYSNTGAALLVVAPSGGDTTYDDEDVLTDATIGTTTTDRMGADGYNNLDSDEELAALIPDYEDLNYTNSFNGTSAATPVVSGVVALMLEANPSLTWRDVQQILVETSVQVDASNEDWTTNGAGYNISYNYGFGLVNAKAAVEKALTWENLPDEIHTTAYSIDTPVTIGKQSSSTISVTDKSISCLETVEITVEIIHPTEGDLKIELISPDGTVSVLAQPREVLWADGGYDNYTFTTKRCWGEAALGDWTLRITDTGTERTGVLNSWSLDFYGNQGDIAHVGPDVVSVFPDAGDSLINSPTLDYAPNQLTVRFTEGQEIDPNTLDAIKLMYRQNEGSEWEEVSLGWVGIGEQPNEVILRPASTFLDGLYELVILGTGDSPLLNNKGFEFRYDPEKDAGSDYTFDFAMTLPLQVTAVVPMPIVDGEVKGDQIEVYFNADKTDNNYYTEPQYYTLFATYDTASSIDDYHVNPDSVELDTVVDAAGHNVMRATLTFSDDINKIFGIYGSYRLKVGEKYSYSDTEEFDDVDGEDFEAGDAFRTSKDVSGYFATTNDVYSSLIINGNIDVKKANAAIQTMIASGGVTADEIDALMEQIYDYTNRWPGGNDEPGHEMRTTSLENTANVEQHIMNWDFDSYDAEAGVVTYFYCFPKSNGPFNNYVTEQQKNSVRQIFQLLGDSCGIQFFELKTPDDGSTVTSVTYKDTDFPVISFFVSDLALLGGESGPGGVAGLGGGTSACLDLADFGNTTNCEYGSGFYSVAMHEIMHCLAQGHTYDLDGSTIMGASTKEFYTGSEESVFPAPADVVHLQYMFRNDSLDVDMYAFTLQQSGTLELETIARRLEMGSALDTVLNLYDENGTLIATNDNYFGLDSLIEVSLKPGKYYVGVSSAGNEDYDPVNIKTGMNGTTEGEYQLKLSFTPAQKASTLLNFDGDMDGKVGGDFNFWFDVQKDENILYVDKTGEFTPDNGTTVYTQIDEAIADAAAMVEQLKATGSDERVIVRILANNTDKDDLTQREAYEIGTYTQGGSTTTLEDGATLEIPKGVSVVVEQGAVIKLANTNITAGSQSAIGPVNNVLDQTPAGTIQLLGAPNEKVYLTSYWDETIGSDSYNQTTTPKSGDWGGIVLTNVKEHEYNESETAKVYGKVKILEDEGVFINYIGFADISYGGGEVNVNGFKSVYAPVYLDEARPTILSNTITSSMTAAISADPNSFEESHIYGQDEFDDWFTADYDRVGPTIHNNTLVKTHDVKNINKATGEITIETVTSSNSVNGLAIRTTTPSQSTITKLDVTARFDDWDITHVIQEDLILASAAGGSEVYIDPRGNTSVKSRTGGSLRIDDNVLIKLGNSRIELEDNANLIAEGDKGDEIIFTSIYDDTYGYGGTFDATNNGFNADINSNAPEYNPENNDYLTGGNWGGLYLGHSSTASLDNIKLMYAGGQSRIEGYFVNFQPIEVVQADLRVTNSYFAYNSAATEASDRIGRGNVTNPAVIYVRNAQPIIVDNNFADNETAIISINANALTANTVKDYGRQTGLLIKQEEGAKYDNLYPEYASNYGPMVRENEFNDNLYNGMVVRGEVLTTESIWDDVDIVHILQDEIVVGNHHTYSGIRLQSSTTGSLVVKLFGNNAGFTAAGAPNDVEDRIGGTVQVMGNAMYPVILTSLYDNSYGAGYDQWGNSVTNTYTATPHASDDDPDGTVKPYEPSAGDWRSIKFQQYSNDRNVAVVVETEGTYNITNDVNNVLSKAQNLGALANNINGGDENNRLGFDIHGTIHSNRDSADQADSDIYSFKAIAGTDIWVDVDLTRYALDTVVELLDSNGNVVARNDRSEYLYSWLDYTAMVSEELRNLSDLWGTTLDKIPASEKLESNFREAIVTSMQQQFYVQYYQDAGELEGLANARVDAEQQYSRLTGYDWDEDAYLNAAGGYQAEPDPLVTSGYASSMNIDIWERNSLDDYGLNEKDSGFKVTLPGVAGVETQYYLRVKSNVNSSNTSDNTSAAIADLEGRTYGEYNIQIRLRETQEKAGCTVQYAQIFYATNGIEVIGTPSSSPLTVDTADVEIGITGKNIDPNGIGKNDTFRAAQNIGNVLETTHGSMSLTGYIASSSDIDWYKFEVKIPNQQDIPGVSNTGQGVYPLTIDVDYSDGMGRANVNLWLFDASGKLIASSTGSNITGDQATPFTGADSSNLETGSGGTGDPYIGTFYVPEGTYYVAVAPQHMTPAALSQQLLRQESVDSVERIVEDDMSGRGWTGLPVDTTYTLNFKPEAFSLADVRMYLGNNKTLYSNNSFTGAGEVDWGGNHTHDNDNPGFNDVYGDYVMRSDGQLYAIDNKTGTRQIINLENASERTDAGVLGTIAYSMGENGLERIDDYTTGIRYEAIVFAHENGTGYQYTNRPMFVIGNLTRQISGVDFNQNLLYMVNNDGTVHSLEGGQDDAAKAGTNDVPLSYLLSGLTLKTKDATDDTANSTLLDLRDGHQLTFKFEAETALDDVIVEFDTGVDLMVDPLGGLKIRDGQTFTVAGKTFEFDSGPVLEIAQDPAVTDGDELLFVNTNEENPTPKIIFFSDSTVPEADRVKAPEGSFTVVINSDESSMSLMRKIVAQLNKAGVTAIAGWDDANENMAQDDDEIGRISFNSVFTVTSATAEAWVSQVAESGVVDGNIAIPFTEWATGERPSDVNAWLTKLDQSVCDAINQNVPGAYASFFHRDVTQDENGNLVPTIGDRITIANIAADEFDAGDTTVFTHRGSLLGGLSGSGVTEGANVIRVRVDADYPADQISRLINRAIENFKLENREYEDAIQTTVTGKYIMFTGELETVTANDTAVFVFDGDINANGGKLTGLAWVGNDLYAVSENGDLYRITYNGGSMANFDVRDENNGNDFHDTFRFNSDNEEMDAAETDWDVIYETRKMGDKSYLSLCDNTYREKKFNLELIACLGKTFTGLTNGPENVEDGLYADLLFATDNNGVVYCFDTTGAYKGVFSNGAYSIETGRGGAVGIDFTTQDFNMWHRTNIRQDEAGHKINKTFDHSRKSDADGNASYYFGMEDPYTDIYIGYDQGSVTNTLQAYVTNSGLYSTYNAAGGTHGSLVSDEFSLTNISSDDQPFMTFEYYLDSESSEIYDSFRIYIRSTDPLASQLVGQNATTIGNKMNPQGYDTMAAMLTAANGQWIMLGTNLDNDLPDNDSNYLHTNKPTSKIGYDVVDLGGGWYQAKIDLSDYAGLSNLQLKLDFTTQSSDFVGDLSTTGELLYGTEGLNVFSGDQIAIDNEIFTFNTGEKVLVYSNPASRMSGNMTVLQFQSPDAGTINVNVFKATDYQEPGVENMNIYITDSTTASEFAEYLTEALNNQYADIASCAQQIEDDILTPGHKSSAARDIVGLNKELTFSASGDDLLVVVGTDTIEFSTINTAVVNNGGSRAENPNRTNFISLVNRPFSITDIYGQEVEYTVVPSQQSKTGYFVEALSAGEDEPEQIEVASIYDVAKAVSVVSGRGGVSAYICENSMIVRCASGVTIGAGMASSSSRGNDVAGEHTIDVEYSMTSHEVSNAIAEALEAAFASSETIDTPDGSYSTKVDDLWTVVKINGGVDNNGNDTGFNDQLHVINHVITSPGFLSAASMQWGDARVRASYVWQSGEIGAYETHQDNGLRKHQGQDNAYEGVFVDNFCISLGGRGTMYTNVAANTTLNSGTPSGPTSGYYLLNIRTATDYGTFDVDNQALNLTRTFRATDRLDGGLTMVSPEGGAINHLQTFSIGDGNSEQRFVMVNMDIVNTEISDGLFVDFEEWWDYNVAQEIVRESDFYIQYHSSYSSYDMAAAIAAAVNSQYLYTVNDPTYRAFSVRAKHSTGSNHVDLYGATWIKGITATDTDCGDAIISEMTGKIVGYTGLKALSYINYGAETATYQEFVNGQNQANDKTLLHGDANVTNGQGQIVLSNNLVAYSSGYGIYSAGNKADTTSGHQNEVFQLASNPDSKYTIYLDFTGHTAVGTSWNGGAEVVTPTYDSNYDLIYEVWQRVAEDFMPWDVNVTTIEPEEDSCAQAGVLRVCIGGSWSDWYGKSAGGVAFLGSFTWDSDTPAYVFADNLGSAKSIAEAASHEIGHTFGLSHDGDPTNEYYGGANGWAPIMGVGYSQVLTQWSKGEYPGATNKQDDVKIITDVIIGLQRTDPEATSRIGVRPDDHGNGAGNATDLGDIEQATSGDIAAGIITTKDDIDWFVFTVSEDCTQKVTIGGLDLITNLDCGVRLYNNNGAEITDPTVIQESGLKYIINLDQLVITQAGMFEDGVATFRLSVEGTGSSQATTGDSITTGSTGNYSDYASLGSYTISIQVPATDVTVNADAPDAIFPGFIVPFSTINDERWVPSTVAYNNILAFNETGGIYFAGNSNSEEVIGTVPYGRIVNNTIWGTKDGDTGILVGSNATATVLNNVVANCGAGISMDGTASSSIVSGYNAYYSNNVNTSGGAALGSNAILLRSGEPLFVNPDKLNFYPEADSRIIDASANVLAQRAEMDKLYDRLGISTSPIQAPDTDIYGQLRADDPNVQNSSGVGANVYKDRGAVERIDWVGPVATIINPVDLYNTTPSTKLTDDSDLNRNDVVLTGVSLSNFILDFIDEGVGIDDDTVSEKSFTIYRILNGYQLDENGNYIDAKAEYENGSPYVEKLKLTYDYLFRYNATLDRVTFIPVTGSWTLGYTYQIEIDCNSASPFCIYDLAGNELQPNRTSGTQVGRTIFNISLSGMNFGDAPDKPMFADYNYQTFLANDGPAHVIIPGFSLGQTVLATADAIVNKDANSSADDDGLEFKFKDAMLSRKEDNTILVTVRNDAIAEEDAATTVAGYVCIWIDVDGDGTWNSSGDFFTMQEVYVGENEFNVSASVLAGGADETFLRARLFTVDTITEAVGSGADFTQWFAGSRDADGNFIVNPIVLGGEVEDYKVYLVDDFFDYGDAAASYGSASHIVDNESGDYIYLGTEDDGFTGGVDAEITQHFSQNATGDDLYGKLDPEGAVINDEQGVVIDEETLTPGEYVKLTVNTANTLGTGYLYVWIDVNANGAFETDECIVSEYVINGSGVTEIVSGYQIPQIEGNYMTAARVRFSADKLTDAGTADASGRDLGAIGFGGANATRGEVEDYQVMMSEFFYDYGDAEDTYKTLAISSGAYHQLTPRDSEGNRATIGAGVTFELDGQPSPMADADEDDGISVDSYTGYVDTAIVVGATVQLPISVTGEGYLVFWIDTNRDGTFSEAERIEVSAVAQRQGTDKFEDIPKSKWNATWGYEVGSYTGVNEATDLLVSLNIPETAKVGETAMRVRFYEQSNDFASMTPAASGFGGYGEVEDYIVFVQEGSSVIEGYKFNDTNNNGIWDVYPEDDTTSITEDGLKGAAIYIDANNNGVWDDGHEDGGKWVPAESIAVTNPFGYYKFENLVSGTYIVREIFNIEDLSTEFTSTFITDGSVDEQAVIQWFKDTYGATLHTLEESDLYLRSYPQRVASIPENDASNADVPVSEKAFTFEFLNENNISLQGCHVYITNYGTNYVDGIPVTYDFILTNVPDMVSTDSTKIYVYFDPSVANPMDELAKNFAAAVNTLASAKMTATRTGNRVTINSGVFDLRVSEGGEKLLPTEDVEWFNILTSHSMPGENLSDGGYQVVVVTKEGDYSGVNFGSYRKPEVAVHQTDIYAEGNGGWHTIQVPIMITKSFGSEFDLYYETADGTAKGYGDPANPYDGNNPTVRANATPLAPEIDFIHTSGTVHVSIDADEIQGGGWQVTPVTVASSSDNYETAIAGDYIVFRAGKDIHYIDTRTAWSEETGYVTINDITRDGEATDDAYLTAREMEDGSVLVVWSKQDPKTLHWSLYYYVIGEATSESEGTPIPFTYTDYDYYAPVIADSCIYYFFAEKAGSTVGSLYSLDIASIQNPSAGMNMIAYGNIPIESLHVNENIDKNDFAAKANSIVFTLDNQIYYKEGEGTTTPTCISAPGVKCYNPQIDGDYIVWEEDVEGVSTRRLVMYTISTGEQVTIRESQTLDVPGKYGLIEQKEYSTNNVRAAIDNGMIVWEGDVYSVKYSLNGTYQVGKTTEILLYDIASKELMQLSDGTGRNATPSINGSLISWAHEVTKTNGQLDKEIVAYDLDTLESSLITRQGNDWDPLVCNEDMIIWRGESKTSGSYELYLASVVEPYYVAYVDVWVYGDTIVEPDEYFYMNVSTMEGNVIVHNDQTQVWLLNDDSNSGDSVSMDYGDAPSTYKVTLEKNGARHDSSDYKLGASITYEKTANSNSDATGDKGDDGVAELQDPTKVKTFVSGMVYTLTVSATIPETDADGSAYLDAWIDFNGDGLWTDDERIADSTVVVNGENEITFMVPYTSYAGNSYARFRLSDEGGLDSVGYAATGEVEDYKVAVAKANPTNAKTLTITSTAAGEAYELKYVNDGSQFVVTKTVGGVTQYAKFASNKLTWVDTENLLSVSAFDLVKISNSAGDSTFKFTGLDSGEEIYKLYQNKGFIYSNGLNVNVSGMAFMDVNTKGGTDKITLLGSNSQDLFQVGAASATVSSVDDGTVYYNVTNIDSTAVVMCYGETAQNDSVEMNTVEGTSSKAEFTRNDLVISDLTGGVYRKAIGFKNLSAYASNTDDEVVFNYVTGTIDFTVDPIVNTDKENTFYQEAYGFSNPEANAASSTARIRISAQEDGELVVSPTQLVFTGVEKTITAQGFSNVEFDGAGYEVSAAMYDSEGDDLVTMYKNNVQMKGTNYLNVVKNVKFVNAYSTSGDDIAKIYDTSDVNYLYAQAYSTTIFDAKKTYSNSATGFKTVQAYATTAGSKAFMYDSVGNDVLVSTSTYTAMSGKSYSNKVYGYSTVNVASVNGGNDVARMYDSAVDDVLSTGTDWAQIESADLGMTRKVSNFGLVEAVATNAGAKTVSNANSARDFVLNTYGWED